MLDKAKFARLRPVNRIWAVAAIHGEAARLARLHADMEKRFAPGDALVYLGDYLGHGESICATLDELLLFRRKILARRGVMACDVVFLRGAQEEMWSKLIQIHYAFNPAEVLEWMLARGVEATLRAYGVDPARGLTRARAGAVELVRWTEELRRAMQAHPGHETLINALRRAAVSDDGALLFVHAGFDAGRPLSAQADALWWGGAGFDTISASIGDFAMIVRGRDSTGEGFRRTAVTTTLDGGCGFGGTLNSGCFDPAGALLDLIEA